MKHQANPALVFVTVSGTEEAKKIAAVLLQQRKAACVNVIPRVASRDRRHGKIDSASESLLLIKTRQSLVPEIVALVKENHSYSVPEIIAIPIVAGSEEYLQWIDAEVRE